jgi:hypothetical protein
VDRHCRRESRGGPSLEREQLPRAFRRTRRHRDRVLVADEHAAKGRKVAPRAQVVSSWLAEQPWQPQAQPGPGAAGGELAARRGEERSGTPVGDQQVGGGVGGDRAVGPLPVRCPDGSRPWSNARMARAGWVAAQADVARAAAAPARCPSRGCRPRRRRWRTRWTPAASGRRASRPALGGVARAGRHQRRQTTARVRGHGAVPSRPSPQGC